MSTYSLIFSDIDGTLLDSRHRLQPATAARIRELHRAGIPFILVSSRPPQGVFPIQEKLDIHAPMVAFGGALILDEDRTPLWSVCLPSDKVRAVRTAIAARWPSVCCTLYTKDRWIVENTSDPWVVLEQAIGDIPPEQADVPDDGVFKMLCMGEEDIIQMMPALLSQQFPELCINPSKPTYLEIMDTSASKGGALRKLCAYLGSNAAQAVAFGDNFNDVDMLEAAGLAVVMGNAPDEVKRLAGFVTADNDHEGLLQALNRFF